MTDGELLERFVTNRDESAFELLVRRHGRMVLGLCRRALRNDHEAEDAFQATFLILVRNASSIRKRESLASWLYGVTQRITRKAQVGAKQRALVHQGEAMLATGPEADRDRFELRPILHDEVGRLPEKYRAPIILCYFEGRSHEEAARQLEWPIGTVKGRLSRARDILQSRLVRRGVALALGVVAFLEDEATAAIPEPLVETTVKAAVLVRNEGAATKIAATAGPVALATLFGLRPSVRLGMLVLGLLVALGGFFGTGGFSRTIQAAVQVFSPASRGAARAVAAAGDIKAPPRRLESAFPGNGIHPDRLGTGHPS